MYIKKNILYKISIFLISAVLPLSGNDMTTEGLYTIASFSTSIDDQNENVKHNIALACERLNGLVLPSGSVFSFNGTVGEGSAKNGFINARVMYREGIRYEPGGGLCQVSSTIFNALLLSGCKIYERHRHYQPVRYVPPGLDATIKFGKKNLRMKNPYAQSLYITAFLNDKSLIIAVKGREKIKYRYEIFTEEEEVNVPLQVNAGNIRQGISVYVYRRKYLGKKITESFLLYKDYYPPVYIK